MENRYLPAPLQLFTIVVHMCNNCKVLKGKSFIVEMEPVTLHALLGGIVPTRSDHRLRSTDKHSAFFLGIIGNHILKYVAEVWSSLEESRIHVFFVLGEVDLQVEPWPSFLARSIPAVLNLGREPAVLCRTLNGPHAYDFFHAVRRFFAVRIHVPCSEDVFQNSHDRSDSNSSSNQEENWKSSVVDILIAIRTVHSEPHSLLCLCHLLLKLMSRSGMWRRQNRQTFSVIA